MLVKQNSTFNAIYGVFCLASVAEIDSWLCVAIIFRTERNEILRVVAYLEKLKFKLEKRSGNWDESEEEHLFLKVPIFVSSNPIISYYWLSKKVALTTYKLDLEPIIRCWHCIVWFYILSYIRKCLMPKFELVVTST